MNQAIKSCIREVGCGSKLCFLLERDGFWEIQAVTHPWKTEVTDTLIVWAHRPYHHCLTWSSMVSWMGRFSKNLRFQAGSRIYIYILYIKVISRTHHEEMHGGLSVLSSTNQAASSFWSHSCEPKKSHDFFFTKVFQGNHHLPVILRKLSLT